MGVMIGELLLFEVMAYAKIPPMKSTGHCAGDWNAETWDWKGRMRVVGHGYSGCTIKLEDAETEDLFACAPVDINNPFTSSLVPVVDSSRYFVLRISQGKRFTYIGLGFLVRDDAFAFKDALQTFCHRAVQIQSQRKAAKESDLSQLFKLSTEGAPIKMGFSLKAKVRCYLVD